MGYILVLPRINEKLKDTKYKYNIFNIPIVLHPK
jgi:hypothetical protein